MNTRLVSSGVVASFFAIGASFYLFFAQGETAGKRSVPHIAFDESMLLKTFPQILNRADFNYVYTVFKDLYAQHNFETLSRSETLRIPSIIHVMWLGGKLPQEFDAYVASWKKYHPQWTILFWTDNDTNYDQGTETFFSFTDLEQRLKSVKGGEQLVINAKNLQYDNKAFYDKAINYGEKSDILKWEIVYRFGGVYVDTDFECLQPLDPYHYTFDLYTGVQPLDTNMIQLGAALYGAIPHHPILKGCVETIKNNQAINQIVVKTGPIHFTKVFVHLAGKTGLRDVALPASYFYPCGYEQRGTPKEEWCQNESAAVHHWAGSWLKPEATVRA